MPNVDIDIAYEFFKSLIEKTPQPLTEADSRAKLIDPIFKECLGWEENDISREEHVNKGYIDYRFRLGNTTIFVLEAKKNEDHFIIPAALNKRRYKINGAISTDNKIKNAMEQAQKYAAEVGATFAIVSNGYQFIIFETFKFSGRWRDSYCVVFCSYDDVLNNFSEFFSILSKKAIASGSLKTYVAQDIIPIDFKRPLDFVSYEDATVGLNILAPRLNPIIRYIFTDITDDSQIEVLRHCYVKQKQLSHQINTMRASFDKLPHYAKQYDIGWFKESDKDAGEFQLSFDKCREFLRKEAPIGSVMMLLGGIGSGKTTFIHHFFKVLMADRKDVLWFYVDFKVSPPEMEKIEDFIYSSIVENFDNRYKDQMTDFLKSVGIKSLNKEPDSLLTYFSMLRYKGYTVAIVLDNVDQHSYTSPRYQERLFELAQHLANKFKTITMLTLREESFFRSTQSGVLDAYHIPKFHIESPNFEDLIRARIDYTIKFLEEGGGGKIAPISSLTDWTVIQDFFVIVKYSIRESRRVGREILRFINDVSGGNMREALRFINSFMTSANTDIEEMIKIESSLPTETPEYAHYQIPLHHIIKSIVLEDHKYYSSTRSHIMNLFQVNPQYTYSHFIHLKILAYLKKRTNYFVALEKGFVEINQIIEDAETGGLSRNAIEDSLKKLAHFGLIEFNNQNKEGYSTAVYTRITTTGSYYLTQLFNRFAYLDLVFEDTPICDEDTLTYLKNNLNVDYILNKVDRLEARFKRTSIFLDYLILAEKKEFESNPQMYISDLTNVQFMENVLAEFYDQIEYIRGKRKNVQ